MQKKTPKSYQLAIHSSRFFATKGNNIEDTGATSLCKALESNTTLNTLKMISEDKRMHTKTSINKSLFSFLFASTVNKIGDTGAISLSESLKSNSTLSELNLSCDDKRHNRHPSTIHPFSFPFASTGNKIGERGKTSLSEALKSNTTLTILFPRCEDKRKKTHKRHPSTIHLFPCTEA